MSEKRVKDGMKPENIVIRFFRCVKKHWSLYLFMVPLIAFTFVFCYIPYSGLRIAFMDYNIILGYDSPYNGFQNFIELFRNDGMLKAIGNTLLISGLNILIVFPMPIIFAILLNELKSQGFKRVTQTISYLPYFLSTIAVIGIATTLYSSYGIINDIRTAIDPDAERVLFLAKQSFFVPNVIILEMWKGLGWGAIIYIAAIAGIDQELYSAAIVDGAGKFRQTIHITIPGIINTVIIMLIMKIGGMLNTNFDLIYGLQNTFIDFETINTLVYKRGIQNGEYDMATAISVFNGVISLILVLGTNWLSKKYTDASLI